MFDFKVTPKNLLLGVLQTGECRPLPIKGLVQVGALFGFSDNVIRVTITRLVNAGLLEKTADGLYSLAGQDSFLSYFVNRWHIGEARRKQWDGSWLGCLLIHKPTQVEEKSLHKAFEYMGFTKVHSMMWARPNNLTLTIEEVKDYLVQLGMAFDFQLLVIKELSQQDERNWLANYPLKILAKDYQKFLKVLRKSRQGLSKKSLDAAAVESFLVGSEVVNRLAVDPLLPAEVLSEDDRALLTEEMLEYDLVGQQIWWEKFSELDMGEKLSPAHINFL